jgi:hypothetical protein
MIDGRSTLSVIIPATKFRRRASAAAHPQQSDVDDDGIFGARRSSREDHQP